MESPKYRGREKRGKNERSFGPEKNMIEREEKEVGLNYRSQEKTTTVLLGVALPPYFSFVFFSLFFWVRILGT